MDILGKIIYKEKEELSYRLELIPKRIMQLLLEIDQLKEKFKEYQIKYSEILKKESEQMVEQLKNSKMIKKEDLI